MIFFVFAALGIITCALFLKERIRQASVKALIFKTLTSLLFVSLGAAAAYENMSTEMSSYPLFIVLSLVFGLTGDVWLDLKWIYPNDNSVYTFAGFVSFLTEHVLLVLGVILHFADFSRPLYLIVPVILSVAVAAGTLIMEKPMKMKYGEFKTVLFIYGIMLSMTVFVSGSLAIMNGFNSRTLNILFAGSVSFFISDLILSGTYFGEGKRRPADVIANHVTYYIGQFLIAGSLLLPMIEHI